VLGALQLPQSSFPPQPSAMLPQLAPWAAQVVGSHAQTLGMPPAPHFCPLGQLPQLSMPPQPSESVPQSLPSAAHVVGTQLH